MTQDQDKKPIDQTQEMSGTTANSEAEGRDGNERKANQLSFWQTMVSVGQASFGVQNQKNKERDFEKGSIKGFVAAALIFTVLFVLTLVVIVNVVLN